MIRRQPIATWITSLLITGLILVFGYGGLMLVEAGYNHIKEILL